MESNNNDFGKSLRNLGLFIGLPLLVVVVIWLFMSGDTKSRIRCIPIIWRIFITIR